MAGNVIGINNSIISPSGGSVGIGFAIPAEDAAPIVQQLISGEEIIRGYLGVRPQPVDDDMAEALGIDQNRGELIQAVIPGEAAERGGLTAGDVVLSVNGNDVSPQQTLSYLVANIRPGTQVPLRIIRDGERRTLNVTVGRRPSEESLRQQQMFEGDEGQQGNQLPPPTSGLVENALGVQAVPVTPQIARQLGVADDTGGLAIVSVDPNSDAGQKGLQRGFIILSANGTAVATVKELEDILNEAQQESRQAVLLRVRPRGSAQAVSVAVRLRSGE